MSDTGYARHFAACNRFDAAHFVPLTINGTAYGLVTKELAAALPRETRLFEKDGDGIALLPKFKNFDERSDALMKATQWIAVQRGAALRGEMYSFTQAFDDAPVAQIDRVAVPWFGARAWGVHVNGFVHKKDGVYLWVGQRAPDRPAEPDKLDNLIGGGQPIGLSREENLCKEAKEEAGIEADLAMTAVFARSLDYKLKRNGGARRDTLFIYDLELPETFEPNNTDGEVAAFYLMSLPEVATLIRDTDKFKFNCNLVIIDFLVRHGFIGPQDAEYGALMRWLEPQSA